MKTAEVITFTVLVVCPHCGDQTSMLTEMLNDTIVCASCKNVSRVSKKTIRA